jgi:enoyl-CoA hydratase
MSERTQLLTTEIDGDVAVLRLDDGKANAISADAITALNAALSRAEKEARGVALIGRPGRFSGGFDLSVMRAGDAAAVLSLVRSGAELAARLYGFPLPVVIGCTGHAIAMGAVLLLSADARVGTAGDFKIGLNEVAIRMTLPTFAVELAKDRLSRRHLQAATVQARLYDPAGAVDAGYLDRVVASEELERETIAEAQRLAQLDLPAHHGTKLNLRGATLERIRASLDLR